MRPFKFDRGWAFSHQGVNGLLVFRLCYCLFQKLLGMHVPTRIRAGVFTATT